jgi:hypothetical protein
MNVYRVVTERDGVTAKTPGRISTDIERFTYHYAADTIQQVWESIAWLRDDPEVELIAVIQDICGLSVLDAQEQKP